MLTETQRMVLTKDLYDSIDFRYPLTSGASQYDYNSGNVKTVFRGKEPFHMLYPAMKINFFPKTMNMGDSIDHVYGFVSGHVVYAIGELEPVIITVYTHQQCKGNSGNNYHGKLVVDDYIRRTEKHVRRFWPSILRGMESSIKTSFPFTITDIADFQEGTERQAYELTFYIITTNKWDDLIDPENAEGIPTFEDAVVSGIDDISYGMGLDYEKYHTLSGIVV